MGISIYTFFHGTLRWLIDPSQCVLGDLALALPTIPLAPVPVKASFSSQTHVTRSSICCKSMQSVLYLSLYPDGMNRNGLLLPICQGFYCRDPEGIEIQVKPCICFQSFKLFRAPAIRAARSLAKRMRLNQNQLNCSLWLKFSCYFFHIFCQILVVDPHNGGSWQCMANMVNEDSRPFLCPGFQIQMLYKEKFP